jgi:hypothetical protein
MKQFLLSLLPRREDWTPKNTILTLLGAGWLAFTASDYGVLTGRKTTYIPGKFTMSGRSYERVRCGYWIGLGGRYVGKAGPPGSMSCPWTVHIADKWKTIGDNRGQFIDDKGNYIEY